MSEYVISVDNKSIDWGKFLLLALSTHNKTVSPNKDLGGALPSENCVPEKCVSYIPYRLVVYGVKLTRQLKSSGVIIFSQKKIIV